MQGKTVLLVDADPQCNLTASLLNETDVDDAHQARDAESDKEEDLSPAQKNGKLLDVGGMHALTAVPPKKNKKNNKKNNEVATEEGSLGHPTTRDNILTCVQDMESGDPFEIVARTPLYPVLEHPKPNDTYGKVWLLNGSVQLGMKLEKTVISAWDAALASKTDERTSEINPKHLRTIGSFRRYVLMLCNADQ